jgi:hypothetical protein
MTLCVPIKQVEHVAEFNHLRALCCIKVEVVIVVKNNAPETSCCQLRLLLFDQILPDKLETVLQGAFSNTRVVEEASMRVGLFNLLQEDHFSISKPQYKTRGGYSHLTAFLSSIEVEYLA